MKRLFKLFLIVCFVAITVSACDTEEVLPKGNYRLETGGTGGGDGEDEEEPIIQDDEDPCAAGC